ncbi:hypothetical protein [Derxia lacustris]|uniref:hypothetical protein n=1 Tax=Derxia lacustris TaxID=764842 RepID=UPI00111BF1F4|nr:hypothetical protein [Derxia lacustris]
MRRADSNTANSTHSAGAGAHFMPDAHIVGLVESIVARGENGNIHLEGCGDLTLFPAQGDCVISLLDGDIHRFLSATRSDYEIAPAHAEVAQDIRRLRIDELLWMAGYSASQGRMIAGGSLLDVVRVQRWPNFSRLPHGLDAMRMVALLTRHPTSIALAARILGIRIEEGCRVYAAATCAGLVEVMNRRSVAVGSAAVALEPALRVAPPTGRRSNLLGQLLSRIMGL